MISDYSRYDFSEREKLIFYGAGYACVFCAVYLFYHSFAAAAVSGVLVRFVRPAAEDMMAGRRKARLESQFKDLLYSLSASVSAGRQMAQAIVEAEDDLKLMYDETEPIMMELGHMRVNIVENKESDKVLLQDLAVRSHSEDINNFVQVYITCRNKGGDLESIIGHAAGVITDKMNIEKEIKVITSQKKTEGRIVAIMPFVMLAIMNVFSYSYISPLYETLIGRIVMTAAFITVCIGIYMMERLSHIEV